MSQCLLFLAVLTMSFSALAERIDFEDLRSTIEESSVIVFGEDHVALNVKKYFPQMVEEIQRIDPAYNCLALEFSESMQGEFEVVESQESYKDFLHYYLTKIPYYAAIYSPLPEAQRTSFLNNFYHFFVSWFDASVTMKQSGGKVFLMDDLTQQTSDTVSSMVFRNEKMGNKISDSLQSGGCHKVIAINGAEHISTWHGANVLDFIPNYKSVGFLLSEVYLPDERAVWISIEERISSN